jgi:two-component system sensor histidine kinase BarA
MRQRNWKRVLGETSLERKCRLLFGFWLTLLISGAFWGVENVSSDLILRNTRTTARDVVDVALMKPHFSYWETRVDQKEFADTVLKELSLSDGRYTHEIIVTDLEVKPRDIKNVQVAITPREIRIIAELQAMVEAKQKNEVNGDLEGDPEDVADVTLTDLLTVTDESEEDRPIFKERVLKELNEYQYYEPVRWGTTCIICHNNQTPGVEGSGEGAAITGNQLPFTVIKVKIPYEETQNAIHNARAILIAVAIVTVFVSMIALYIIIRLLVVRPLNHLRDVSDRISRGDLNQRADINTDDEFEELGTSFNRMVRHLTEAQQALKLVNDNLDIKVDEMAQLNMQLYDMNRMKDEFMANMSHELRTPLNSIIGFSEILQGVQSLDDKQTRYAENIQRSGRMLLEMINEILDLAKIEAGKLEVKPIDMLLAAVVTAQCDLVRSLVEEKNISLEVKVKLSDRQVTQDQGKIQQILTNLLSNAIKFTPEGGRITVTVAESPIDEDCFEIQVVDTGIGIAEEDRDTIFEKFRQGNIVSGQDSLTREYAGTGLGLSIVKELCRILGGEVTVKSQLGIGSTFTVLLPYIATAFEIERGSEINRRVDEAARIQNIENLSPPAQAELEPASEEESEEAVESESEEAVESESEEAVESESEEE